MYFWGIWDPAALSADAEDTGGEKGGGGAGGSIRIEGYDVTLSSGTVTVDGADQNADGGDGRVAVYYENTKDLGFTPGYLKNTSTGAVIIDFIFSDGFESGDLTEWPTTVIDGGDLATSGYADFWGYYGLKAVIDDQTSIYVEDDDSGNGHLDTGGEPRYRARFYFDPNGVTIGSGEILDILVGLDDTTEVLRVQVQDNSGTYQVRVSVKDDSTTWTDSSWYDITDGWNAIEIDWQAASAAAADDGSMELWIDGTTKQTLSSVDNDTRAVDGVRMGAMGVDAGTSGTVYFDDFEARRLGYIDVLASPYTPPQPPDAASWQEHNYDYDDPNQPGIPHAVKAVDHPTGTYDATYEYDVNGNMECRVEENITWVQEYNEENRIEKVRQVNGDCSDTDEAGDTQIWRFTYDGDGVRVYQEYVDASGTVKTYYFAGGMYEVVDDGSTTTKVYYSIGGISVAMDNGTDLVYFASDHLSSASIVMSDTGTLLSEQRYMPFGEVRTDVGTAITQTDFGYTGQRDFLKVGTHAKMGLMDYNARFYSPTLGRFTQPDTIVPDPSNPQSLNRFSYVNNSPILFNDPSGHYQCMSHPDCYSYYDYYPPFPVEGGDDETETDESDVTIIFVCGAYVSFTGCEDTNKYDDLFDLAYGAGYNVNSFGSGTGEATKENKIIATDLVFAMLNEIVITNPNATIYLVGHSAGADAVVEATYQYLQAGGSTSNIGGIVILDSYLNVGGEDIQEHGVAVDNAVMMWGAISSWNDDEEYDFPSTMTPKDYTHLEHEELVTNEGIQTDIWNWLANPTE